jgi:hypothetical protein
MRTPSGASNAISLPSGDHSGVAPLVAVRRRMSVPSGRTTKIPPPSRLLANAISRPSGDHEGPESDVSKSTSIPAQEELSEPHAASASVAIAAAVHVTIRVITVRWNVEGKAEDRVSRAVLAARPGRRRRG